MTQIVKNIVLANNITMSLTKQICILFEKCHWRRQQQKLFKIYYIITLLFWSVQSYKKHEVAFDIEEMSLLYYIE